MQYIPPDNFDVMHKVFRANNIIKRNYGVEVGVRHGFFSEYLLKLNPYLSMILVDPYMPYIDGSYVFTEKEQEEIMIEAANRLEKFNHRAKWCYITSKRAADCFDDESFDFCFIDASHLYVDVKADITLWWNKVRIGGLLSGHDFSMQGVSTAIKDWMFENKIKELFTSPADQGDCWWVERV
jgi:hypothetical protein